MISFVNRYFRNYNRSAVETLLVGRVWWEADVLPVFKVEGQSQDRYKYKVKSENF